MKKIVLIILFLCVVTCASGDNYSSRVRWWKPWRSTPWGGDQMRQVAEQSDDDLSILLQDIEE